MTLRAPYDARAIANYLLDISESRNIGLTQLSLYKIIYFAHGWYLADTGGPLIVHDFEAWERGPVIKVLRDAFKSFGKNPITIRAKRFDLITGVSSVVKPELSQEDGRFVSAIYEAYHVHDAWKLSEMTHEKGSPWDKLWNSCLPVGRLALRIQNEEIKAHFDRLPRRFALS